MIHVACGFSALRIFTAAVCRVSGSKPVRPVWICFKRSVGHAASRRLGLRAGRSAIYNNVCVDFVLVRMCVCKLVSRVCNGV
jgi:hypothetical protein